MEIDVLKPVPKTTLEQWMVLRTIVDMGGFEAAARRLNKSQSAVSYAMTRLQEQLQVDVLQLKGRRAVLTPAGKELLAEAAPLIDALLRLEDRAKAMLHKEAFQIRLIVDAMYPKDLLFTALKRFAERYPHVGVVFRETVRLYYEEVVGAADFDIAIVLSEIGAPAWPLAPIPLMTVAAAGHPLARMSGPISPLILNSYARVEIRGYEFSKKLPEPQGRLWIMNSLQAAVAAVRSGLCHAILPRHVIESELAAGEIVPIEAAEGGERQVLLSLVVGGSAPETDAVHALFEIMRDVSNALA